MPTEIAAFFESYCRAFNALDGAAVAELYAEPSGIAQGGVYTHWRHREAIAQSMSALCALYRDRGYVCAEFEPSHFVAQGDQYAIADLHWTIRWTGDRQPWRFNTTYNLVRTPQGWRVLLCTAYTEDKLFLAEAAV